jgi:hypothetical protein
MHRLGLALLLPALLWNVAAAADYRITQDYGGLVNRYKLKYLEVRDRGERVIIDGFCGSACTLVLGIVPLDRICVTPRARLGFHAAFYHEARTDGVRIVSYEGTADVESYYPEAVKEWLSRHGGLAAHTKTIKSGPELWAIVDPCPDEFF